MNRKAWLIVHLKLVEAGDRAIPSHVGIYSESPESLTRAGGRECLAGIMSAGGRDYAEASESILKRIAGDVKIRGLDSEYRWILPLMNDRDATYWEPPDADVEDLCESTTCLEHAIPVLLAKFVEYELTAKYDAEDDALGEAMADEADEVF